MTAVAATRPRRPLAAAWRGWERFWFAPTDPLPLALVRIGVGVVALLWTVSLFGQLGAFFSAGAIPILSVLLGAKVGCELSVIIERFRV